METATTNCFYLATLLIMLSACGGPQTPNAGGGDKSSKNDAFVHAVCEQNVKLTVDNIRKNSPILAEMEKKGEIIILGGVYDMNSGKVAFY